MSVTSTPNAHNLNQPDLESAEFLPELAPFLAAVGQRIQKVREFRGMSRK